MTGELVGEHGTLDPAYWARLNFIQPPFCASCGSPFPHRIEPDADAAANDAAQEHQLVCGACLQDHPAYHRARSVWRYDDAARGLILKFKHADGTQLAPLLSGYLHRAGHELWDSADLILPIPLHRWRLLKRRYNQANLLAALLARRTGIPYAPHLLRRIRATESQGHKTRDQRRQNVADAFHLPEKYRGRVDGKRIILIDDVLTSGATVEACVTLLRRHGAASVDVLTLAKVISS